MTDIKITKISTEEDLNKCFHIRTVVFVDEQKVPIKEEIDGLDGEAEHYLLLVNGKAVATARIRIPEDAQAIFERVAVLKSHRGHDLGRKLMEFIIADLRKNPAIKGLKLGAQLQAIVFYEKLGFKSYGNEYYDASIKHIWMKRNI